MSPTAEAKTRLLPRSGQGGDLATGHADTGPPRHERFGAEPSDTEEVTCLDRCPFRPARCQASGGRQGREQ